MPNGAISMKFLVLQIHNHMALLSKFDFPVIFGILNFCIKCNKAFISEIVWDRAIPTNFSVIDYGQSHLALLSRASSEINPFYAEDHLELLHKMDLSQKKCVIEWSEQNLFLVPGYKQSHLAHFTKNCLPAIFCVKHEKAFISKNGAR